MKNLVKVLFLSFTISCLSQNGTMKKTNTPVNFVKNEITMGDNGEMTLSESNEKSDSKQLARNNSDLGIGETQGHLAVSLTGAAVYNIPIMVPTGINGVQPAISINYDSQSGNGIAGFGWNISGISSIKRIPSTKYHDGEIDPVDFDVLDRYALDGQRLILKTGSYSNTNHAIFETESFSNLKIEAFGSNVYGSNSGPLYFKVYYPDGSIAQYGNGSGSRSRSEYSITYWQNPQGVRISYEYISLYNTLSISKIKYGTTGINTPINEIQFEYDSSGRERWEQIYIGNQSFLRKNLLKKIRVFGNNQQYRYYDLQYDYTLLDYNRLKSVTEYSGDESSQHSSIEFGYQDTGNSLYFQNSTTSINLTNIEQRNATVLPFDLLGEGKMDFIVYPKDTKDEYWLVKDLETGTQNFTYHDQTGPFEAIFSTRLVNSSNKLMPGQGYTIVKDVSAGNINFEVFAGGSSISPVTSQYIKTWSVPTYSDDINCYGTLVRNIPHEYISGDFNGDGLTDVLAIQRKYIGNHCTDCGLGCCNCFDISTDIPNVKFIDLNQNLNTNFVFSSGQLIQSITDDDQLNTGDWNGDGKTDLFHTTMGKVFIYSIDSNNVLQHITTVNHSVINTNNAIFFGDFNGDGKTDFMSPSANNSYYYTVFISSGTGWTSSTKTQPFIYKKSYEHISSNNVTTYYGHNLVPMDVNGDGRTDIIRYNTRAYSNFSNGNQDIRIYNNVGIKNQTAPGKIRFEYGGDQSQNGNLKTFPIPIFLPSPEPNKSLEFATISDKWITNFTFHKDHRKEMLLQSIENGGITQTIEYSNLNPYELNDTNNPVYESSNSANYPFVNINYAPNISLVKRIQRSSANSTTLQRQFRYKGAITNFEGIGFQGFEAIAQSNWHTNNNDRIYSVKTFDPFLRGALTSSYSQLNYVSFSSIPTSGYIDKTTYSNAHSLSSSKVFKLWVNSTSYQNGLDNTYINTTYSNYDSFLNPQQINTNYNGQGSVSLLRTYANNTGGTYYIGRLTNEVKAATIGSETFNSEIDYSYVNHLVDVKRTKGNSTPFNREEFDYDTFGNVTEIRTIPNGETARTVIFDYDTSGRFLEETTDIEGLVTQYQYNFDNGNLENTTNPFGQTTIFDYDEWHRVTKVTDYKGNNMTTSYVENSNHEYTVTQNSDDGSATISYYDALKRLFKLEQKDVLGQWVTKDFQYDKFDRLWKESEPYIGGGATQWNETLYDVYGRPVTQNIYTGRSINVSYNALSTTVNDGVKTVTTQRDGLGNTVNVTDPGGTINYNYFGNGSLKSTNYNGVIVSLEQDGWGRKTKLTDPSAGIYKYEYNGFGEVTREDTPKGKTLYEYDDFGKLKKESIDGDNTFISLEYSYHPTNKLISSISMTSSTEGNAYYDYSYDNNQLLESITETNDYARFNRDFTYDNFDRVETVQSHAKLNLNGKTSDKEIANIYQNGYLKHIKDLDSGDNIWEIGGINSRGQLTIVNKGDKLKETWQYDSYGYLQQHKVNRQAGGITSTLMNLTTSFDAQRGTLDNRTNSMFSWSESFSYDNLDRLVDFNDNTGNKDNTYDSFGRITASTNIGTINYQGNSFQPEAIDLNAQGDLYYQQNPLEQITYNAFKKPVDLHERDKERIGFKHNAFKQRAHMFYGNDAESINERRMFRHYSHDGNMEITYDRETGKTVFVTYLGGDAYNAPAIHRVEYGEGGDGEEKTYFLHRDYLGSIMLINDFDGNPVEKRHFDAWGNVVKVVDGHGNPLGKLTFLDRGYTGHEHLTGINLINMNGRVYDPNLKRFLSPDNYIQDIGNTQNFNRYAYVLNNPLRHIDPSGELAFETGLAIFGIASAAFSLYNLITDNWDGIDNWLTKNIFEPIQDWQPFKWIENWFGGGKRESRDIVLESPVNFNIDPLAGSSMNIPPSYFGSSGKNGNLGISKGENSNWLLNQVFKADRFAAGFRQGALDGAVDTLSFFNSLGTKQGWVDLKNGLESSGQAFNDFMMGGLTSSSREFYSNVGNAIFDYASNIPNMTAYEMGHNAGYFTEKTAEVILITKGANFLRGFKLLRGPGGGVNGFTISKGSGYGAKPRIDFHRLGRASKKSNSMSIPSFLKNRRLLHWHRGRGNNLHRHRPWEKGWNDGSFWDRF
ncbi:MAG: RHS repeat-associated core domain-containing protein [Bacteroidota bacterium]